MPSAKYPERIPPGVPESMVYDFNQEDDPEFAVDPWKVLDRIRKEAPPIFYSTDTGYDQGIWWLNNEELIREMLQENSVFTTEMGIGVGPSPWPRKIIPLEMDPPDHRKYRAILSPMFSPRTIAKMEDQVKSVVDDLIDSIFPRGECEFLSAFAKPMPSTILVSIMGLPQDRRAEFVDWVEEMFHAEDPEVQRAAGVRSMEYLKTVIAERYAHPEDDAISLICQSKVDGETIGREYVEDIVMFIFQAGLDTVTAGLGHVFTYLVQNPDKQRQLKADPSLIPNAVEEMLRAFSWISVNRKVRAPDGITFHDAPMRYGDAVFTIPYSAGRDPSLHPNPDVIDFAREDTSPNFAFGAGVHRCAGSHLARRELVVSVEQWLERIGEFKVKPGVEIRYKPAGMFQLENLPLVWDT